MPGTGRAAGLGRTGSDAVGLCTVFYCAGSLARSRFPLHPRGLTGRAGGAAAGGCCRCEPPSHVVEQTPRAHLAVPPLPETTRPKLMAMRPPPPLLAGRSRQREMGWPGRLLRGGKDGGGQMGRWGRGRRVDRPPPRPPRRG